MSSVDFKLLAHIRKVGDRTVGPNEEVGVKGRNIEGFQITFNPPLPGLGLRYMARLAWAGDTPWAVDGNFVGTRGQSQPIEGFAIELTGEALAKYDVLYKARFRDGSSTTGVTNGGFCGTCGKVPVEMITVDIVPRQPQYISLTSKATSETGKPLLISAPYDEKDFRVLVSSSPETDLGVWDRRPVRSGQGFALINKKRPTLCIARDLQNQGAILKDVKYIATDDTCVWRDDTVPSLNNAINSWSDWAFKLNMAGNKDADNILNVQRWADGIPNERWMTQPSE